MPDLKPFIVKNRDILNLAEISREAGYADTYLKNVLRGRNITPSANRKIRKVLDRMFESYTQGSK